MNSPFVTRNITLQAKDKNRETSQENKQGTKTKGVAILRKIQKKSASIKIETVNKTGRQIKKKPDKQEVAHYNCVSIGK